MDNVYSYNFIHLLDRYRLDTLNKLNGIGMVEDEVIDEFHDLIETLRSYYSLMEMELIHITDTLTAIFVKDDEVPPEYKKMTEEVETISDAAHKYLLHRIIDSIYELFKKYELNVPYNLEQELQRVLKEIDA